MNTLDLPQTDSIPSRINACLDNIFDASISNEKVCESILHCTQIYLGRDGLIINENHVQIDYFSLEQAVSRFQRDAFGVKKFHNFLDDKEKEGFLSHVDKAEITNELRKLGIRINTVSPRKTRVAAAFLLWMANFRPFSLSWSDDVKGIITENKINPTETSAKLSWLLAQSYLSRYGTISLREGDRPSQIRLQRIFRDLTVRDVNLSSIELFLSGLFTLSE